MVVRKVGKYEVGRTIGEGTFAKVKFAQNTETGESVAVKVLDRATIIKHKMVDQIKREISIMKLVRHPHVIRLHEVLASRTKIYIILEFITGGELFDKIVRHGKVSENDSRRYYQQLIDGVDYCHSKGVFHRDLKPENLLLDSQGSLKISDFGLSALPAQGVSLLHTTCGTPNYVAPEVLSHKGYDGAIADIWSCGVILYVLMAGYLPFDEVDLTMLYGKIEKAEFSCPSWFSIGAKSLIQRILDPNPDSRIRIEEIRRDEWFRKNYVPTRHVDVGDVNLDDVDAAFDNPEIDSSHLEPVMQGSWMHSSVMQALLLKNSGIDSLQSLVNQLDADNNPCIDQQMADDKSGNEESGPINLNAFDLIILSQGLNLSALFDRKQDNLDHQTRFLSCKPAKVVLSTMEVVAQSMGFKTHIRNYKMRVEGLSANKTTYFSAMMEIFEVAPSFIMVEIQKAAGDASEYLKFNKNFCSKLDEIIWKPPMGKSKSRIIRKSKH